MKSSEIRSASPHPVHPQLGGSSISVRKVASERARDDPNFISAAQEERNCGSPVLFGCQGRITIIQN